MIPRGAAGALLALPAAPAFATCRGWQACTDAWLWEALLPGTIIAGLAIWVAGPLLVAVLRGLGNRREPPPGSAGRPGDGPAA